MFLSFRGIEQSKLPPQRPFCCDRESESLRVLILTSRRKKQKLLWSATEKFLSSSGPRRGSICQGKRRKKNIALWRVAGCLPGIGELASPSGAREPAAVTSLALTSAVIQLLQFRRVCRPKSGQKVLRHAFPSKFQSLCGVKSSEIRGPFLVVGRGGINVMSGLSW